LKGGAWLRTSNLAHGSRQNRRKECRSSDLKSRI